MEPRFTGLTAQKGPLVSLALYLAVLICYWPVRYYGFVSIDDLLYLTQNSYIRSGLTMDGVACAFRTVELGYWRPLTWLSCMLDFQLFCENAGGTTGRTSFYI